MYSVGESNVAFEDLVFFWIKNIGVYLQVTPSLEKFTYNYTKRINV